MAAGELRAAVRERDGVAVIDLVGDVNASTASTFALAIFFGIFALIRGKRYSR